MTLLSGLQGLVVASNTLGNGELHYEGKVDGST